MNAPDKPPTVAIIVLNWNGKADTLSCLGSLRRLDYPSYSVVVVDNGSSDNSVHEIRLAYPDTIILENGANLGYAGGNNVGLRYAVSKGYEYVLVLNNDTECDSRFVTELVAAMTQSPAAAFAGPLIYYHEPPTKVWSCGVCWDKTTRSLQLMQELPNLDSSPLVGEVDSLVGCAILARCSHLTSFGLLDERYFLMHEETDWCYRAKARGYKCVIARRSVIWHKISSSFGGADSPLMQYFSERNMLIWAFTYLPLIQRSSYVLHRVLSFVSTPFTGFGRWQIAPPTGLAWQLAGKVRRFRETISSPGYIARISGFRDYFLSRFGDCPPSIRLLKRSTNQAPATPAANV